MTDADIEKMQSSLDAIAGKMNKFYHVLEMLASKVNFGSGAWTGRCDNCPFFREVTREIAEEVLRR